MLNQLPAIADDRRRTLLAEAEAHRLARQASAARPPARRRTLLGVLRLLVRRATDSPARGRPDALPGR